MVVVRGDSFIAGMTTDELAALLASPEAVVVLLPVGAIEPHGPHLPLDTDLVISRAASVRAVTLLRERGIRALIAPEVAYGVTDCARGFAGAAGVTAEAFAPYLRAVVAGWLANGVAHVCVVNNHLEPAHDAAVRESVASFGRLASVACPLTRRWARTLDAEFRRGACHAGEYETSIVQAAAPDDVREATRAALPDVDISLSERLAAGAKSFVEMGLARAYAGSPSRATPEHGNEMIDRLGEMIATEVAEALRR